MRLKALRHPEDLDAFGDRYGRLGGIAVAASFLERCCVVGLFASDQSLIGGFCLNDRAPFRTTSLLKGPVPASLAADDGLVEVACLWVAPSHRGLASRLFLVVGLYLALLRLGHRRLLAVTTKEALWRRIYAPVGCELVAETEAEPSPGQVRRARVFTLGRRRLLVLGVIYALSRVLQDAPFFRQTQPVLGDPR